MLTVRPWVFASLIGCAAFALTGCNDSSSSDEADGPGGLTKTLEALSIESSPSPVLACALLSDRFLTYTYETSPELARKQCEREAGRQPGAGLTSYEIHDVKGNCAVAAVTDQDNRDAVLVLRMGDGDWEIDEITSAAAPEDVKCPRGVAAAGAGGLTTASARR